MKTIFSSTRSFVVFSYAHSHGLLLLRSRKTPSIATRQDILFQDVRAVEVRARFDGITIEEADDASFLADRPSNPAAIVEPGVKLYRLKGNDWSGFVVGGIWATHEDAGEFLSRAS
jgi:hypothetical protein